VRGIDPLRFLEDAEDLAPEAHRERMRSYQEAWRPDRFSPTVAREMRQHLLLIQGRAGEALLARLEAGQRRRGGEAPEAVDEAVGFKRMELSRSEAQSKQEVDSRRAEEHLRRAQQALRSKDYHEAVLVLQQAIRLNETAETQALLAEALAQNPRWAHRAEHAYRRAMELDQFDPRLPVALGRIYQRAGLTQRAREMFERALQIQPDFDEARRALKELPRS
jgi:tetratricopeptide (TPR) repeat protein